LKKSVVGLPPLPGNLNAESSILSEAEGGMEGTAGEDGAGAVGEYKQAGEAEFDDAVE